MKWYPAGDYCFHLIRTSKGARCRIEFHSYSDNREEEFDADTFALTRLDRLLKERDVAQLDGYSVHSPGAANHMDLLVQYTGGERIAATGIPPQNNQYFNEEWFIDFFRNLSGALRPRGFRHRTTNILMKNGSLISSVICPALSGKTSLRILLRKGNRLSGRLPPDGTVL